MTTSTTDRITSLIQDAMPGLVAFRRDLHQHPELGYEEKRTNERICAALEAIGVEHVSGLAGGTGVVGFLPATTGDADRAVALRADIDALPIEENTGVDWTSTHPGVMHACGHDGHTAMLLGAATVLSKLDERPNPVLFVFQPAEEGGAGGERICADGALDGRVIGPPARCAFGMHGWPALDVGEVSTRIGPLLAAVDLFRVRLEGVGSHAAQPHVSRDPVIAVSQCVLALQSIVSRNVDPVDSAVVSVTGITAGSAHNVIPQGAEFFGTVRTLQVETREMVRRRFHDIIRGVASAYDCEAHIDWMPSYPVTRNDATYTRHMLDLARDLLGRSRVKIAETPNMGGEDFSYYAAHAPTCFFLLGLRPAGQDEAPGLHQPNFDFNDEAMPTGVEMFCRLALADPPPATAS